MGKLVCFLFFFFLSVHVSGQSVAPVGNMNEARISHESQLLNDGRVLVFGGNDHRWDALRVTNSAELYNPHTKQWTLTSPMLEARHNFASVLLNDGRVLAIGGGLYSSATCEVYNPATGTWQQAPNMAYQRSHHAAVKLADGRVMVAGGILGGKSVEIFDPASNTWETGPEMQFTHGSGMAFTLLADGSVLATGGESSPFSGEVLDAGLTYWTQTGSQTQRSRAYHSMVLLKNGEVLVAGSRNTNSMDLTSTELYDPVGRRFYATGNTVTLVGASKLVLLEDGKVLLYGLGDMFSPSNTKCIQIYNPATGTWSAPVYNFVGAHLATAQMLHNGQVLLAGGAWTTGNGASASGFLYNQDNFAACAPVAHQVNGSSVCNGASATVTLPATESGATYSCYIGPYLVSNTVSGGGQLILSIPGRKLLPGTNVVKVKWSKPGCLSRFLDNTAQVQVGQPSGVKPAVTASGPLLFCAGNSIVLSGPAGMAGYEWNTGETTASITVNRPGQYRFRVADAQGCMSVFSDPVVVDLFSHTSTMSAGVSESACITTPAFALSGHSPVGLGTWSGNGVNPEGIFDPALAGVGTHTLTYTVCGKSSTKNVVVKGLLKMADFTFYLSQASVCYGGSANVRIDGSMQGARYEYWNGGKLVATATSGTYSAPSANIKITDDRKLIVRGIIWNECSADTLIKEVDFDVPVDAARPVLTKTPFVCKKNTGIIYIPNAEPEVRYQLKQGTKNVGEPQTGTGDTLIFRIGPVFETATYSVTGTKAQCVTNLFEKVTIEVAGPLAIFGVNNLNPEIGDPVKIMNASQNPGGTYQWILDSGASFTGSTAQDPPQVTFSKAGVHHIKLISTGVEGCKDSLTVKVNVLEPVVETAMNFSVATATDPNLHPMSLTSDAEGNRYAMYLSGDNYFFYSNRTDSITLQLENLPGYGSKYVLVKYNAKGTLQWATYLRHQVSSGGGDLVTDANGNIYLSYYHQEHLDDVRAYSTDGSFITFDPPTAGNSDEYSVVLVKYNKDGMLQWHTTFLERYVFSNSRLLIDSQNNLIVSTQGKLLKYNAAGTLLWKKEAGYDGISLDSKGNIWGVQKESLFIDQYNAAGTLLFSSGKTDPEETTYLRITISSLKMDAADNLYVTGNFSGNHNRIPPYNQTILSFNNEPIMLSNGQFLCKFKSTGAQDWIKLIQGGGYINGLDIQADKIVFLTNTYNSTNLEYNLLSGTNFQTKLAVTNEETLIVRTDTTAAGLLHISNLSHTLFQNKTTTVSLLQFSKVSSDKLLFYARYKDGLLLGQPVNVKKVADYQSNRILIEAPYSTLFPPMPPKVQFGTTGLLCTEIGVQFLDMSAGEPTSWNWSFPGGTPASSTEKNPVVTYPKFANYAVTLQASNATGVGTAITQSIAIGTFTTVTLEPFDNICMDHPPLELTGGQPIGGTYSGPGVRGRVFYPETTGPGTFRITYSNSNSPCRVTAVQDIVVTTTCTSTGMDMDAAAELILYPNPTAGKFALETPLLKNQALAITIFGMEGKQIKQYTLTLNSTGKTEVDMTGAPVGIYHLQIRTKEGKLLKRNIVIQ